MSKLTIEKTNAIKAFHEADTKGKSSLSNLFGKEVFNQKITDRVKTFEDACEVLGLNPFAVIPSGGLNKDAAAIVALAKIAIISRALNEGWEPDWRDWDEYKYYVWQRDNGSGLSSYGYSHSYSLTGVGSRLCYKTADLAIYAGKQFESLYTDLFTL